MLELRLSPWSSRSLSLSHDDVPCVRELNAKAKYASRAPLGRKANLKINSEQD